MRTGCVKRPTSAASRQFVVSVALQVGGSALAGMLRFVPLFTVATGVVSDPLNWSVRLKYQYSRRHVPPKRMVCLSRFQVELLTT